MARPPDDAHSIPIDPDLVGAPVEPRRRTRRFAPYRVDPRLLAAVAAGGAIGGPARYALARALPTATGSFPWATFWTNVSGAFVLGASLVFLLERFRPSRYLRAFLGTGICGAYTTFSTFMVETDLLVKDRHLVTAAAYVAASLVFGLAAVYLGMLLGRLLPTHPSRRLTP